MGISNKIVKLSVAIVLLFSLLFVPTTLAVNTGENNILFVGFLKMQKVFPIVLDENSSLWNNIDASDASTAEDNISIEPSPEPMIKIDNDKIAEEFCKEAGLEDMPCWQDLKAMRQKESYDGKVMTGDGGRSKGWYHIQVKMHNITEECALDFECSTIWTVKNLISHNYETNRFYAISRHNGGGIMAKNYAKSVISNSAKYQK